jgi:hypothetical protein
MRQQENEPDAMTGAACCVRPHFGAALAAIAVATVVLAVAGCGGFLEATRRHTYPPTFNYISDEQLESAMWQLAAGVRQLSDTFDLGAPLSQGQRVGVIETIRGMEAAATRLGPEGWPSNHHEISDELGHFRETLANARRAVAGDPPSYRLARDLPSACLACHMGR